MLLKKALAALVATAALNCVVATAGVEATPTVVTPHPAARATQVATAAAGTAQLITATPPAYFNWFEYSGHDAVFDKPLPAGSYRNPILAGFYPDPSITRAGDRFYLVNSTFTYFPGIPVFESRDLVHWRHVSNVIDRPGELRFEGLGVSRGVFAPSITYHDGVFYVLNTAVDAGGNFLSFARDPAGPWSDPIWLPELDGIDPSLFFDRDGKVYLLNNGPPAEKPRYDGHRAIWIQEFDLAKRKLVGPRKVLINGGVDISQKPAWIEGPHLYRRGEWVYLMCAEGGTSVHHSEVVLRSHSPWGPFSPYAGNPILTQRDLPPTRAEPIENAGHADLVEGPDGKWWAVFLASRVYDGVHYNTGRETFLLPVTWREGWPVILDHGKAIPYVMEGPRVEGARAGASAAGTTGSAMRGAAPHTTRNAAVPRDATTTARDAATGDTQSPLSGNFTWRDDFDSPSLNPEWLRLRIPTTQWADLTARPGWLAIHPLPVPLNALTNPSFLARRQQHLSFDASTQLALPEAPGVAAGLAAFQNESHWYFLGVRRNTPIGATLGANMIEAPIELFLEKRNGPTTERVTSMALKDRASIKLRISGTAGSYSFYFDADAAGWKPLTQGADGSILSTDVGGGFVGAVVGPYARAESDTGSSRGTSP
ncbi:MAG TPA: glycoside hydrolase family 43 protein [Steroidobacteraceae bacterium]|jgi:alpha-N-arabinofuranosidase